MTSLERVPVAGLVADIGPRSEAITKAVALISGSDPGGPPAVVTALHVGGLVARNSPKFADALCSAGLVCADGQSVLLLGWATSGLRGERASTTDVGVPIIVGVQRELGRPIRLALVGGPPGLAPRAGEVLAATTGGQIVFACDGYQQSWREVIARLNASAPDILVLGIGSPLETIWANDHRNELRVRGVITCGGWFGFLAGDEMRAPKWMQMVGLEWSYRLIRDPHRLFGRYVRGAAVVAGLTLSAIVRRLDKAARVIRGRRV